MSRIKEIEELLSIFNSMPSDEDEITISDFFASDIQYLLDRVKELEGALKEILDGECCSYCSLPHPLSKEEMQTIAEQVINKEVNND